MVPALVLVLALLGACDDPPDPKTVEGAFAIMAGAAEEGSTTKLFETLDDESRNSVSAVHRAQREAKRLLERDYPRSERSRAAGRWRVGSDAKSPAGVFAGWCLEARCLEEVRDRLSAIATMETHEGRVRVRVRRGRDYEFVRRRSGRWGLTLFEERLRRWKIEVYRDLDAIRASARIYREAAP